MSEHAESQFSSIVLDVWADFQRPDVVWQIAALAVCLVSAWAVSRLVHRWPLAGRAAKWEFGVGGLKRVLLPLVALLGVLIAREALRPFLAINLLNLAVPLLGSLALIRLIVYTLRYVFAPSGLLAALERTIDVVVWSAVALYLVGVLPRVIDWLNTIQFPIGRQRISIWLALQTLTWATVTVLAALWASRAIERRLMRAETLDTNLRVVFSRLVKALLIFLAVVIVLPIVGIDITVLSVFGGAIGVGIGLGLQKIASNYISGFILLLERSIRIGDLITADQFYGVVKDITTRYVLLRGFDGRDAIIPNELLITSKVLNHSFTDKKVSHALQLQVGYSTDVERALRLMEEIAARQPRVLADPPPSATLTGFADSGIALEVGFWVGDPELGLANVKSAIGLEVLRAFRREGIEIPYPQREVRILGDSPSRKVLPLGE